MILQRGDDLFGTLRRDPGVTVERREARLEFGGQPATLIERARHLRPRDASRTTKPSLGDVLAGRVEGVAVPLTP